MRSIAAKLIATTPIQAPSWVPRNRGVPAVFHVDFLNDRVWQDGRVSTVDQAFTVTRSSSNAAYESLNGVISTFAADTLRLGDNGYLYERADTNVALHSRDLTQSAWTKTNCTAALDQVGKDAVSNAASSLTATSDGATCLQSVTLASSVRMFSAYVKRLSGSGTLEMTTDGGTTWVKVFTIGSDWARLFIPSQTVTNPSFGFRIGTSGDSFAIDMTQNENEHFRPSSPIITGGSAVTRSADVTTLRNPVQLQNLTAATFRWTSSKSGTVATAITGYFFDAPGHASSLCLSRMGGTNLVGFARNSNSSITSNLAPVYVKAIYNGALSTFIYSIGAAFSVLFEGSRELTTGVRTTNTATISSPTAFRIGATSGANANDYMHNFSIFNEALDTVDQPIASYVGVNKLLIADGDSMLAANNSFISYLKSSGLFKDIMVANVALSGSSLNNATPVSDLNSSIRAEIRESLIKQVRNANPNLQVVYLLNTGHNDVAVDGNDGNTVLAEMTSHLAVMKASGYKTVCMKMFPSTSAGVNTARAIVNPGLDALVGTTLDAVIDHSSLEGCADGDESNINYYPDGIHPSDEHYKRLAALMIETILPLFE